jgi:hypothetical protein
LPGIDLSLEIDFPSFTFLDAFTNFGSRLASLELPIAIDDFLLAGRASDSVVSDVTIKKTFVALIFVAGAIAGHLIQKLWNLGGQGIGDKGGFLVAEPVRF